MRRKIALVLCYMLFGAIVNVGIAWGIVAHHGTTFFEWKPYHNPRDGAPVAFFVNRRFGWELVTGCGRPGTLLSRHADEVESYQGMVWWPKASVTFDMRDYAISAGWPMRSMMAWHTLRYTQPDDADYIEFEPHYHRGYPVSSPAYESYVAILPFQPLWIGFCVNTLLYAFGFACLVHGPLIVCRYVRTKKRLCVQCGYSAGDLPVCPECGTQMSC
ncbi:MAG: hypothetical protein H6815_03470 [Phycisphaeraceae bacterium]|nr:hypothetical protein [Phycisphaerales bacterium]MCB9859487.1 hypothetical protein [Phycisphaeraceae bacterium]